jgi:hypothetical protein
MQCKAMSRREENHRATGAVMSDRHALHDAWSVGANYAPGEK